ncbi:MAG: sulfite exporter TauE/SafE family protein [Eggerthellaceae bacterium]|nr:sulfite exporter TauE/SafE family protein [Eggerthellaceae bacterium]
MTSVALIAVAAALLGALVGVIAGMLGVGGGTVYLPVFRLVFGLSAIGCTATSLFTISPTSISGAIAHMRNGTCMPKLGVTLGVGGALTSWMGVRLADISPSWVIMTAAALAIAYSAITMLRKALAMPKGASSASNKGAGSARLSEPEVPAMPSFTSKQYAMAFGIGAAAGLASGFIGLGGGFLMVPMMVSFLRMPMKLTSGTSLIAIMILALPATVVQCLLGNVDFLIGIAVSCGAIPGALMGAKLMKRIPERTLRFAFAGLLLVGAVMLMAKEFGLFG